MDFRINNDRDKAARKVQFFCRIQVILTGLQHKVVSRTRSQGPDISRPNAKLRKSKAKGARFNINFAQNSSLVVTPLCKPQRYLN